MNAIPPSLPPISSSPRSSEIASRKWLLPAIVGALLSAMALSTALAAWWIITKKSDSYSGQPGFESVRASILKEQGAATLRYWNSVCALDNVQNSKFEAAFGTIPPRPEDPAQQLNILFRAADLIEQTLPEWESGIIKLPMLNVDEALLNRMREDIKTGEETKDALVNMTKAGRALAQWNQSQSTLPPDFWSDLVESFAAGLMGHPFAGYNKAKAKEAQLNAEGQRLAQAYYFYGEELAKLLEKNNDSDAEELKLRAQLTAKYGVEFPARPQGYGSK